MQKNGEVSSAEEKCIICGKATGISPEAPIIGRKGYVNGCGQLCSDCYYDLYLSSEEERKLQAT